MRKLFLLSGMTMLLVVSMSPTVAATNCVDLAACALVEDGVTFGPSKDCKGPQLTGVVDCDGAVEAAAPFVNVGPGEGDCSAPITLGGPVACNIMTQFLCDDAYEPTYGQDCDETRVCRGPGGVLERGIDGDRDGQCDNADDDDDNDGVPDECDPHANNQDLIQETIDYVDYYVLGSGSC